MEISITNPGKESHVVDVDSWKIQLYEQDGGLKPREASLVMSRSVPIQQFAEVVMIDDGMPLFRGFVPRYVGNRQKKTINCMGVEALLLHSYTNSFNFSYSDEPASADNTEMTLGEIFSHDFEASRPGLLMMANHALPIALPYEVYSAENNIIKLPGWGLQSRLGSRRVRWLGTDLMSDYFDVVDTLVELDDLQPAIYRDDTDIYIRFQDSTADYGFGNQWHQVGGLLAENFSDTHIRCGTVDDPTDVLVGELFTQDDVIGDLVLDIAKAHNRYVQIRETRDYTCLDFLTTEGRSGEDGEGIYTIYEDDVDKFEKSIPNESLSHILTGRGPGRQYYTAACSPSYQGFLYKNLYDVSDGYADARGILKPYTDDEYAKRATDYGYKIWTHRKLRAWPGDSMKLVLLGEAIEVCPLKALSIDSKGEYVLNFLSRDPDSTDVWAAMQEVSASYSDYYMRVMLNPITDQMDPGDYFYPADDTHAPVAYPHGTLSFDTGSFFDEATEKSNYRVLMDFTLNYAEDADFLMSQKDRWGVVLFCNGVIPPGGIIDHFQFGETLSGIDLSEFATQYLHVEFRVRFYGDFAKSHSVYTSHPKLTVSGTCNFMKRLYDPSYVPPAVE
jgi:hypothetical protein